ncbi:hypothetical protein [Mobilicoccus massiliensis]|uniref:hypothetical protein n=1 Tax=Mobilicoccus massiliensis TaxID=1522310 RepID=UPI00058D7897|nr:hypothetical protein [Mobilicoccus massiliensis]
MAQQQPAEQKLREAYDKTEKQVSRASEELVASQGFAEVLATLTSNAVALSRVVSIGLDQAVRATRFAGQRDIQRLGRQLNRTEDKLEQVLQVVENLEDELAATRAERDEALREARPRRAAAGRASAAEVSDRSTRARRTARTAKTARAAKSASAARSASVTPEGSEQ